MQMCSTLAMCVRVHAYIACVRACVFVAACACVCVSSIKFIQADECVHAFMRENFAGTLFVNAFRCLVCLHSSIHDREPVCHQEEEARHFGSSRIHRLWLPIKLPLVHHHCLLLRPELWRNL